MRKSVFYSTWSKRTQRWVKQRVRFWRYRNCEVLNATWAGHCRVIRAQQKQVFVCIKKAEEELPLLLFVRDGQCVQRFVVFLKDGSDECHSKVGCRDSGEVQKQIDGSKAAANDEPDEFHGSRDDHGDDPDAVDASAGRIKANHQQGSRYRQMPPVWSRRS